jgi:O-antigen ligase
VPDSPCIEGAEPCRGIWVPYEYTSPRTRNPKSSLGISARFWTGEPAPPRDGVGRVCGPGRSRGVAAVLAWRWRAAVGVAVVAAVMIPVGVAAPQLEDVRDNVFASSTEGLNRATGGRFDLLSNGVEIAVDHPLVGVGVGGFKQAFAERDDSRSRRGEPASHNAVITVAAETGFVGLALIAWVVAAGLVLAFRQVRASQAPVRVAGLVAGLGIFAVFVHSLFYSAFLEDPLVWGFLALAALAARRSAPPEQQPLGSAR